VSLSESSITNLRVQLRDATHHQHVQLNQHPLLNGLMQADYPLEHYQKVLLAYSQLYQALEAEIDDFVSQNPLDFDYHSRRKFPAIQQDLNYFNNLPQLTTAELNSPTINSMGQLIGLLYVIEGSTLGGQHIARGLEKHLGLTQSAGAKFFYGYGEQTQSLWQDFIAFAESLVTDPEQINLATTTACQTFELFILTLTHYWHQATPSLTNRE
jgi:heme oxygenase